MTPKLALAAKSVIVDRDSGVPSAIGIMENITAEGFPLFVPELAFLTVWSREENESDEVSGELRVSVDGESIIQQEIPIVFRGSLFTRSVTHFRGIPILKPGRLLFQMKIGDNVGSYYINIRQRKTKEVPEKEPNK